MTPGPGRGWEEIASLFAGGDGWTPRTNVAHERSEYLIWKVGE